MAEKWQREAGPPRTEWERAFDQALIEERQRQFRLLRDQAGLARADDREQEARAVLREAMDLRMQGRPGWRAYADRHQPEAAADDNQKLPVKSRQNPNRWCCGDRPSRAVWTGLKLRGAPHH